MPADPHRLKDLFAAALDLPPADRAAFLDECGDQRDRVEALLAAHDAPASALERPLTQTADHTPTETPGMIVAGRYKLLESIGEGGMGEVWVADQLEPIKRRVALKLIKPGMDSRSVLARFEAERQALALMDHPNIAKVLDAGTTEDGRPYFVMELVKGTPITTFCDARKLTPKERLELFVPVCQAIQHAHHKGIIHRDIKPTNVLVALHDEKPVPKVIDFGVAKAVGQQLTEKTLYTGFGALVGTPAYMAPEQATFNQLDIDTRADVYALGVLLYELLAGSPPVEPERLKKAALDEVLRLVREEEPPRPSARLSTSQSKATIAATRQTDAVKLSALMRGELDWIVMKALEKDRTRRYETANGLAKDVERYLKGDAVEACPPTLGYRLRKAYRRNRTGVLVTAAFASLLVGAALAGTLLAVQAKRAEADARAQRAVAEAESVRAGEAEQRAKDEAAAAKAVRDFLQIDLLRQADMIAQAETNRLAGNQFPTARNPTINELLDRAAHGLTADKIESKFPGQPRVQAEILNTVGQAYYGIGSDKKAIAHLNRAAELDRATLGPDAPVTLATLHALACAYRGAGDRARAVELFEQVHAAQTAALGAKDPATLETLIELGLTYSEAGRAAEGLAASERAFSLANEALGPSHKLTLIAQAYLALAYQTDERLPEAIRLVEAAHGRAERVFANDHPYLYAVRALLAELYQNARRPADAVPLLREVVANCTTQFGEDAAPTLFYVGRLSQVYQAAGQADKALPLLRKTFDAARRKNGPAAVQQAVASLCLALAQFGRHDEAVAVAREVAAEIKATAGAATPAYANALMMLGRVLMWHHGVPNDAEPPMREAVAVRVAAGDTTSADYAGSLSNLGLLLLRQGRHAEAEPLLRDCLAIRTKVSPGYWIRFNTTAMLGWSLVGQGKHAEGEPLLRAGYAGMKAREGQLHPIDRIRLAEAASRLADLCAATNRPDEAATWRAEAANAVREQAPPPRPVKR